MYLSQVQIDSKIGGGGSALEIEGLLVPDSSPAELLCCVLEQVTLSAA